MKIASFMPQPERLFPTTSQTLLEKLHRHDQKTREVSLARFCTLYYPSVYGFARKLGLNTEDAQDRTQDFFMDVVSEDMLGKFDPKLGARFSSWLMKCFKNLEINHRASKATLKRGGGQIFVEFDPETIEHSYQSVHGMDLPLGPAFDLMLARSLWRMAQRQLSLKYVGSANETLVLALQPYLLAERWPGPPAPTQEELALKHERTVVTLKAFYNRTLKAQARRLFSTAASEANPGISKDEITDLWTLLGQYGEG